MKLNKLTKTELVWMATHKCKHGHAYITHPACYAVDHPQKKERIGVFDIECSNLSADFGIVLSWAIKEVGKNKVYGRYITAEELKSKDQDKALVSEGISELENFDRIVGFYSSRFDGPFFRARAMAHNLRYPEQGAIKHTDLYFHVRSKLKIHSNRLAVACDFLGIPAKGHKLDGILWTRALSGDEKSLKHIFIHNKEDVESTELLLHRLLPFFRFANSSL